MKNSKSEVTKSSKQQEHGEVADHLTHSSGVGRLLRRVAMGEGEV